MENLEGYKVAANTMKSIITDKLKIWKNTVYDAGLDAKVAAFTEDERLLQAAQKRLKSAIKAVEFLEEELIKSQNGDGGE